MGLHPNQVRRLKTCFLLAGALSPSTTSKDKIRQELAKRRLSSSSLVYITAHPPKGIGATLELIEKVIGDDEEALAEFRSIPEQRLLVPS
jgi:hypothetical protein